jgi:TonB family protein
MCIFFELFSYDSKIDKMNTTKIIVITTFFIEIGFCSFAQTSLKTVVFKVRKVKQTDVVVENKEEPTYMSVEESATFQGGDLSNFNRWINQNLQYPALCADASIQGRVFIQFAVDSNGNVCDVRVLRSVHPELDKEAVRVVSSSPVWFPAKQNGKIVKQLFVIPIIFRLQ